MIFTSFIEWYEKGPVDLVSVDTKNNSEWESEDIKSYK